MQETKIICGIRHIRKRCGKCKEMVWRAWDLPEEDGKFFCSSCYDGKTEGQCGTGGGYRVIRSGKEMGG